MSPRQSTSTVWLKFSRSQFKPIFIKRNNDYHFLLLGQSIQHLCSVRNKVWTLPRPGRKGWNIIHSHLKGSLAPLVLPPLLPHIGPPPSTYSSTQVMALPNIPSQRNPRRHLAAFSFLPPHPIPNANPNLSLSTGTRRPRTPSMDGLYSAAQPPSKRLRSDTDDQRAREPRSSYSGSVCLQSTWTINYWFYFWYVGSMPAITPAWFLRLRRTILGISPSTTGNTMFPSPTKYKICRSS